MAADLALSRGADTVLTEHLEAAIKGPTRSGRPTQELGRIPFAETSAAALHRAHDAAVSADETVGLHHLRDAITGSREA
jgi:hypothetical protein